MAFGWFMAIRAVARRYSTATARHQLSRRHLYAYNATLTSNRNMLFSTPLFTIGFLPLTLAGTLALAKWAGRRAALLWLLAASLAFYAWWTPSLVVLLISSIVTNFLLGGKIRADSGRRRWLIFGLFLNLATLGIFKYANFLGSLCNIHLPGGGIVLPLGISFFTFQQVMYLVDTYRASVEPSPFLEYACVIAFFPHLIAGPIVRPARIIPQFRNFAPLQAWRSRLVAGAEIFLLGLAKKLVLADGLAQFADPGFAAAARLDPITLLEAWVALLAYGLQIYFDFSGYSEMAIGLAKMFGIAFPINFDSPYQARNISDFWRRWNITLSFFLRDYLYIPLGGNRRGETRRIINLMVTMLLGGLWHGAALRFVVWGGLHGLFLAIHGWFGRTRIKLPASPAWAITLLCVLLAWVPFRAASFPATLEFYRGLFGLNGIALPEALIRALPALGRLGHIVPVLPYLGDARTVSLPEAVLFLALGWTIVLALPHLHKMNQNARSLALAASFALTMQALFLAPFARPFLYFQF
jgi:D-alanyl-lipoteichoic acid acyltransferase DltB (MBOAT superfamily)